MDAHISVIILCLTSLVALSICSWAMLTAWRDWLALKQLQLKAADDTGIAPSPTARIELAALKERVRKLEAIASGVDLLP